MARRTPADERGQGGRNALAFATMDRLIPPLVWGRVFRGTLGGDGVNSGCSPNGHILLLTPSPVRATLLVLDTLAGTLTEHRLVNGRTGDLPALGGRAAAMERLEGVVLADGRFSARSPYAWDGWRPPSPQLGDWLPGPVDRFGTEMHMRGRKGLWIARRSGGGFTVSLDRWMNFKVCQDGEALDLGSWLEAMDRCAEEDAR